MTVVAHTTPYPWPFDGELDAARTALVVVGGGAWCAARTPDEPTKATRLARLRANLAETEILIVLVEHRPHLHRVRTVDHPAPELRLVDGDIAIVAAGLDGFYGSALDRTLQLHGRTDLLVCGYGLESAVHSTVRRANDRGYECLTVIDATLAHDPDLASAARSTIEMSGGIFGTVGACDDVVAAYVARLAEPTLTSPREQEPTR